MQQHMQPALLYRPMGRTPDQALRALNPRQQRFVAHYMAIRNAAEAARQAGYSTNGAKVQGHRLLSRGDIQAALQWDGVELARAMARAATPEIITMLTNEACDDKARPVDSIRASLLLLEIGGFLKRRGGRRA